MRAEQKLYMLIIKFVEQSTAVHFFWRQEGSAADMLDLVAGKVQSLCNFPVGKILWLFGCWLGRPKSEQKSHSAQTSLTLRLHFLVFHCFIILTIIFNIALRLGHSIINLLTRI